MEKKVFQQKLGGRIRQIRLDKGMTQNDLAIKCDKDKQSVERLENGKINPSAFYLIQISKGLETPVSSFFEVEEFQPENL